MFFLFTDVVIILTAMVMMMVIVVMVMVVMMTITTFWLNLTETLACLMFASNQILVNTM